MLNYGLKAKVTLKPMQVIKFVTVNDIHYPYLFNINKLSFSKWFNSEEERTQFLNDIKKYKPQYELIQQ
jgi:hypothetical protein